MTKFFAAAQMRRSGSTRDAAFMRQRSTREEFCAFGAQSVPWHGYGLIVTRQNTEPLLTGSVTLLSPAESALPYSCGGFGSGMVR